MKKVIPAPFRKTVLTTIPGGNEFGSRSYYVATKNVSTVEKAFGYRGVRLCDRQHARRMAGEGAKFLRIDVHHLFGSGFRYEFVFLVKSREQVEFSSRSAAERFAKN